MHIEELIENLEIVPQEEIRTIEYLIAKQCDDRYVGRISLIDVINDNYSQLGIKSTAINFVELLIKLKFNKLNTMCDLNQMIRYFELILSIIYKLHDMKSLYSGLNSVIDKILFNINLILEKLNCEYHIKSENKFCIIVEKDKATTEAIECIEDEEVALELLEYNRVALKGNLDAKRKILNALANYVEPILKKKEITSSHYSSLADNLGYALNSFHIRHNNMEGKNKNDKLVAMTNDKIEKWYDDTYTMMVMLIIAEKELVISKNVKEFKQS